LLIEFIAVLPVVDSSVTVRTQCDDVIGVIGSAVTSSVEVVNLEEGLSIRIEGRGIITAPLTHAVSSAQGVLFDHFRSTVRRSRCRVRY
jgi:hypothetical protein